MLSRLAFRCLLPCVCFFALAERPAQAQVPAAAPAASPARTGLIEQSNPEEVTENDAGPAGIIPAQKGFELSVVTTSQHDSSNGWESIITPDLAVRFNRYFSADVTFPLFTYVNVEVPEGPKANPVYVQRVKNGVVGDTFLNGHFEDSFGLFDYSFTASLGLWTGKSDYGLGAGQPTYNFNNHFEKDFDLFAPSIELGIGDASSFNNSRVRRSYTSVGLLGFFQAGLGVSLPFHVNFEADAYEAMPLQRSTIYSTTGRGRKKVTTATTTGAAEDNGFLTTLDIPLQKHVTLSGFYNRSLRSHDDVGGFSLLFLLRGHDKPVEAPEVK